MLVVFSIVSHGHRAHVEKLLGDIRLHVSAEQLDLQLVVTSNIPEEDYCAPNESVGFTHIKNLRPKGFGANHNCVFEKFNPDFFFVVNPDIRILEPIDLKKIIQDLPALGIASPIVYNSNGKIEDFARKDVTPWNLAKRHFLKKSDSTFDWLAGMFLIFNNHSFNELKGFDTSYFLYLEDCDICNRMTKRGGTLKIVHSFPVQHDAQRSSRKSIKYFQLHIRSLLKYWFGKIF